MALQFDKLMNVAAVATPTAASIYANPAATKSYVGCIVIHNSGTVASRTVTLNNVPNAGGSLGTASTGNQIFKLTVAVAETLLLEPKYPWVLTGTNDAIFGSSDSTGVTVQLLGSTDS